MRKIGIIGLPQAGKSSLFQVLTHRTVAHAGAAKPEAHLGVVSVPDARLDRLAALFKPKRTVRAHLEFADIHGSVIDVARGETQLSLLREVDGLAHVVRAFEDASVPHAAGSVDPSRDIENVELELMLSDLALIEKRLARLGRDLKKVRNPELEREDRLLVRLRDSLEKQTPLREVELDEGDDRIARGFMFLSAKPMLFVVNLGDEDAAAIEQAETRYELGSLKHRVRTAVSAFCGKIESEIAELEDEEAKEFLASFGLKESGVSRLLHASYDLMGLISFFTTDGGEARAWSVPRGTTAVKAAGAVHTDMEKGFIRAELVGFEDLAAAGTMAEARSRGTVKIEGKEYVVEDGQVIHFRHSR